MNTPVPPCGVNVQPILRDGVTKEICPLASAANVAAVCAEAPPAEWPSRSMIVKPKYADFIESSNHGGIDYLITSVDHIGVKSRTIARMEHQKRVHALMTHNPDVVADVPASVQLVVAGHTHGGQVAVRGRPLHQVSERTGNRWTRGGCARP